MRRLQSKVSRARSPVAHFDFSLEVLSSSGVTNSPGDHLQLQICRNSTLLSSQHAHAPSALGEWEAGLGLLRLTSRLHVEGGRLLEKPYKISLLRASPPVLPGKKWETVGSVTFDLATAASLTSARTTNLTLTLSSKRFREACSLQLRIHAQRSDAVEEPTDNASSRSDMSCNSASSGMLLTHDGEPKPRIHKSASALEAARRAIVEDVPLADESQLPAGVSREAEGKWGMRRDSLSSDAGQRPVKLEFSSEAAGEGAVDISTELADGDGLRDGEGVEKGAAEAESQASQTSQCADTTRGGTIGSGASRGEREALFQAERESAVLSEIRLTEEEEEIPDVVQSKAVAQGEALGDFKLQAEKEEEALGEVELKVQGEEMVQIDLYLPEKSEESQEEIRLETENQGEAPSQKEKEEEVQIQSTTEQEEQELGEIQVEAKEESKGLPPQRHVVEVGSDLSELASGAKEKGEGEGMLPGSAPVDDSTANGDLFSTQNALHRLEPWGVEGNLDSQGMEMSVETRGADACSESTGLEASSERNMVEASSERSRVEASSEPWGRNAGFESRGVETRGVETSLGSRRRFGGLATSCAGGVAGTVPAGNEGVGPSSESKGLTLVSSVRARFEAAAAGGTPACAPRQPSRPSAHIEANDGAPSSPHSSSRVGSAFAPLPTPEGRSITPLSSSPPSEGSARTPPLSPSGREALKRARSLNPDVKIGLNTERAAEQEYQSGGSGKVAWVEPIVWAANETYEESEIPEAKEACEIRAGGEGKEVEGLTGLNEATHEVRRVEIWRSNELMERGVLEEDWDSKVAVEDEAEREAREAMEAREAREAEVEMSAMAEVGRGGEGRAMAKGGSEGEVEAASERREKDAQISRARARARVILNAAGKRVEEQGGCRGAASDENAFTPRSGERRERGVVRWGRESAARESKSEGESDAELSEDEDAVVAAAVGPFNRALSEQAKCNTAMLRDVIMQARAFPTSLPHLPTLSEKRSATMGLASKLKQRTAERDLAQCALLQAQQATQEFPPPPRSFPGLTLRSSQDEKRRAVSAAVAAAQAKAIEASERLSAEERVLLAAEIDVMAKAFARQWVGGREGAGLDQLDAVLLRSAPTESLKMHSLKQRKMEEARQTEVHVEVEMEVRKALEQAEWKAEAERAEAVERAVRQEMEASRQESVKEVEERASVALSSAVTRGEREIELVRAEMTQQMAALEESTNQAVEAAVAQALGTSCISAGCEAAVVREVGEVREDLTAALERLLAAVQTLRYFAIEQARQEVRLRARLGSLEPRSSIRGDTRNRFNRHRVEDAAATIGMSSRRWKCVRVARSLKCLLDSLPSDLFQIAAPVPAMRLEVEQKGALKLTARDLLTDAGGPWEAPCNGITRVVKSAHESCPNDAKHREARDPPHQSSELDDLRQALGAASLEAEMKQLREAAAKAAEREALGRQREDALQSQLEQLQSQLEQLQQAAAMREEQPTRAASEDASAAELALEPHAIASATANAYLSIHTAHLLFPGRLLQPCKSMTATLPKQHPRTSRLQISQAAPLAAEAHASSNSAEREALMLRQTREFGLEQARQEVRLRAYLAILQPPDTMRVSDHLSTASFSQTPLIRYA
ncbi:MAG: hypothetical protein SGPRY_002053 [Prymnesium sp.]